MGRLVVLSQPRASVQGTRMLFMLTPPDSVRRRPMLSQLWANLGRGCVSLFGCVGLLVLVRGLTACRLGGC